MATRMRDGGGVEQRDRPIVGSGVDVEARRLCLRRWVECVCLGPFGGRPRGRLVASPLRRHQNAVDKCPCCAFACTTPLMSIKIQETKVAWRSGATNTVPLVSAPQRPSARHLPIPTPPARRCKRSAGRTSRPSGRCLSQADRRLRYRPAGTQLQPSPLVCGSCLFHFFVVSSQWRHVPCKCRPIKKLWCPAFASEPPPMTNECQFGLCMAAPPPRPRRGAAASVAVARRVGRCAPPQRCVRATRPRGAHVSQPPFCWRSRQPCRSSSLLERLPLALPHPPPPSRPRTSACASAACDRRAAGAMAGLGALWDLLLTALEETLFSVYLVVFRVTRGFIAVRLAVAARGAADRSSLCGTPSCFLSRQLQLC